MWFTRLSIKNPYLTTVLMLALLLLGLVSINRISVEEFPNIKFPVVVVTTNYRGAPPNVIETEISKPLENALNSLNGIKDIRSYSSEGQSVVVAEFKLSVDPDKAVNDSRDKVSAVASTFNKDIDNPIISKVNIRDNPVMSLAFSSDTMSIKDLTDWVNRVAIKKLQIVEGVGEVKIIGGQARQVRINIEPYKLQSLGLSVKDVINAINNANQNYSSGDVKTARKDISLRLNGKLKEPSDFANIVITSRNNVPIKVSDVATVVDGSAPEDSLALVNGEQAIGLDIRPNDNGNIIEIATGVKTALAELNNVKPDGIKIVVTYDQAPSVEESLSDVGHTLTEGAILTILIVFIFLKSWRSTVITGLTLPIALIGTIFAIYAVGFTLNMMSLLALSLSIGLLIDDAIVVRENIVRHMNMGKNHHDAALDGTNEIGVAVLATTLTVIAVFLPVGLMKGIIGKFFLQFGMTVVVAVLISLFVSFSLDPMLSSIWNDPLDGGRLKKSRLGKWLDKFEDKFDGLTAQYEKFICLSLRKKKTTLGIAFLILVLSFMLVPIIGGEFIPSSDKGEYVVNFETAIGSNIPYTHSKIDEVSKLLRTQIPEIKSINAGVNKNFGDGKNNASLDINIGNKNQRHKTIYEIMDETRNILKPVAGVEIQSIMPLGGLGGDQKPIDIDISGDNINVLQNIAHDLTTKIKHIKNVTDLENSYEQANPTFNININRDIASNLGVNLSDVGNTVSVLFAGNKVGTWEDAKTGETYDVMLQIPPIVRNKDVLTLLKVPVHNSADTNKPAMVPLSAITTISSDVIPRDLEHVNLQRNIAITGNILGNDNQSVFNKIEKVISEYKLPPGFKIQQSGDKQDMEESFGYAVSALLVGVAFIYMILAAQFRSFILPLVIMVALPLSFVGVFVALFLFHSTLNMFSIIGIIMLMGLATKNGILLVDFVNKELLAGIDLTTAIVNAGKIRLRPIIMTTSAMIFGMLPLALSNGVGSETRKSMAFAIIGGITTSTILTLIIVPVVFVYLYRLGNFIKSKFV